jgi:hypothetical protein
MKCPHLLEKAGLGILGSNFSKEGFVMPKKDWFIVAMKIKVHQVKLK